MNEDSSNAGQDTHREISRLVARKLSIKAGQHAEPYRGYGHKVAGDQFVFCAPDGKFYVRDYPAATIGDFCHE